MFKKLLPMAVVLALVLLLCGSASAEPRITQQQQAIDAAKKLLPEVIGDKQVEVDFRDDDYRGIGVWDLSIREDVPSRNGSYNNVSIEIDENGSLVSLNYYGNKTSSVGKGIIERSKAKEIALNFLKRMQPNKLNQIKLEDTDKYPFAYAGYDMDLNYSFRWSRIVNGIPVSDDGVNIVVDAVSGQITHYDTIWHEVAAFPSRNDNLKKPQELTNLILEKLGVYPSYDINSNSSATKAQLVYSINARTYMFDAVTGKAVSYDGTISDFAEAKRFDDTFTPETGGQGITVERNNNATLTTEKAQSIAEKFFKDLGYQGKVVRSGGGSESGPGYHIEHWNYRIEEDQNSQYHGGPDITVSIDTSSGKITGFNNWDERKPENKGNPISYDKARTIAEQFVQKDMKISYPIILQKEDTSFLSEEPYQFNFVRLLNGVPSHLATIGVSVSRYSGKVVNFNSRFLPVSIPKIEQVIDANKATGIIKENLAFELCYNIPYSRTSENSRIPQLVYRLKDPGFNVDAVTGKVLTREIPTNSPVSFGNHWAAVPLQLLAKNGLLPQKDFNPDAAITRRDAIRILGSQGHYYYGDSLKLKFTDIKQDDPDAEAFIKIITMGILENKGQVRPNDPLTREQLAVWLVNGIGYQEVANLPIRMESPFKDVPNDHPHRNSIAIIQALGVFNGDENGLFKPQQPVTWAELASVITKVAPKLNQGY